MKNKTLLMITHVIPCPPSAGNEIRILKILKWFRNQGYQTVLLLKTESIEANSLTSLQDLVDMVYLMQDFKDTGNAKGLFVNKKVKHTFFELFIQQLKLLIKLAVEPIGSCFYEYYQGILIKNTFCPTNLVKTAHQLYLKYNPSVVIAEYIFTSPCLDVIPSHVLKIIDTHDMFSRKRENVLRYGIKEPLACTREEERNYLLKCDLILAIQSNEEKLFRQLVPEKEVLTVGIDYDVVNEINTIDVVPNTILVVASDNPLNIHGLSKFCENAWPLISEKNPEVILRVVGKVGKFLQVNDERIQAIAWVEDLDDEYRKASVVINPTMAGTGLKVKSVEALCQGKPLVAWPNGVEGLDFTGEAPFIVCNSWSEFAGAILALLESEEERTKLQCLALRFAKQCFGSGKIYFALAQRLQQHKCRFTETTLNA